MVAECLIHTLIGGAAAWDCYREGTEMLERWRATLDCFQDGLEFSGQCSPWAETKLWAEALAILALALTVCFCVAVRRQPYRVLYWQLAIWLWVWRVSRDVPHVLVYPGLCATAMVLTVVFVNVCYAEVSETSIEDLAENPTDKGAFFVAVITPLLHMVFMLVNQHALLQPYQGVRFFVRHVLIALNLLVAASLFKYLRTYIQFSINVPMNLWEHSLLLAVHLAALSVWLCSGRYMIAIVFGADHPAVKSLSYVSAVTAVLTPSWVKELVNPFWASIVQFVWTSTDVMTARLTGTKLPCRIYRNWDTNLTMAETPLPDWQLPGGWVTGTAVTSPVSGLA